MPVASGPALTKSRYLNGLQCSKRLWLSAHAPELGEPLGLATRAIIEQGVEVGRAAHALFPGGVLVDVEREEYAAALARTRALLADESVPALFEAAFEHAGVHVRVDVLERLEPAGATPRFGLREVKSSASVKADRHLPDLAVQLWVLRGCGLEVPSVELVHVDRSYELGEDRHIDWTRFFVRADERPNVEALIAKVAEDVPEMLSWLARGEAPEVAPGKHCHQPHECPFWKHCTEALGPEWHLAQKRMSDEQRALRQSVLRTGRPWVSPGLAARLAPAEPPVWYLDFEALSPAVPLYPRTHPYDAVAFQWSLHRLEADGRTRHIEFLADGRDDPREETARTLLAALAQGGGPDDAIVVYSDYEARMLRDMARAVPALAGELQALRPRLFDLLNVVRGSVYHPAFAGSYSIKAVGPALVPEVGYDDLGEVAEGVGAALAFARIASGELAGEDAERLRDALLAYCGRDTEVLMAVHRAMRRLAS